MKLSLNCYASEFIHGSSLSQISIPLHYRMHTSALQFSYHSNHLFWISTRKEIRASRLIVLDFKPRIPFSGHKFVGHSSWRRSNFGFRRSLCGEFASMAFSGRVAGFGISDGSSGGKGNGEDGNGGFGNSDGNSGGKDDGDDDKDRNLVGSWFFPGDKCRNALLFELWKSWIRSCGIYSSGRDYIYGHLFCRFLVFFMEGYLRIVEQIVLPCTLALCILAVALCAYIFFYCLKWLLRGSEENASGQSDETASSPPDDVECCICLSTYEGRPIWRSLPCNHWFHSSCVNSWLRINPSCPICKQRCL